MPPIDPVQLLNCLKVLLNEDTGGLKGPFEAVRISRLMEKYSNKIVSKNVFVFILKESTPLLLNIFMDAGGWNLIYNWLKDAVEIDNIMLIQDLLTIFDIVPVTMERLKANFGPKLVKKLSKTHIDIEVKSNAQKLVEKWLKEVETEQWHRMGSDKESLTKHDTLDDLKSETGGQLILSAPKIDTGVSSESTNDSTISGFIKLKLSNDSKKGSDPNSSSDIKKESRPLPPPAPKPKSSESKTILQKKNYSILIEKKENVGEKKPTVKTYKSKFRSTGLEEQAPPPPHRKSKIQSKKSTKSASPLPLSKAEKRSLSPPSDSQSEKKLKCSPSDTKKLPHAADNMESKTPWRYLDDSLLVDLPVELGTEKMEHGSGSQEKKKQILRAKSILPAIYFTRNMVPDSPEEPDQMEIVPYSEPLNIPLEDMSGYSATINNYIGMSWPEPKGDQPPIVEFLIGMNNIMPMPNMMIQQPQFPVFACNQINWGMPTENMMGMGPSANNMYIPPNQMMMNNQMFMGNQMPQQPQPLSLQQQPPPPVQQQQQQQQQHHPSPVQEDQWMCPPGPPMQHDQHWGQQPPPPNNGPPHFERGGGSRGHTRWDNPSGGNYNLYRGKINHNNQRGNRGGPYNRRGGHPGNGRAGGRLCKYYAKQGFCKTSNCAFLHSKY